MSGTSRRASTPAPRFPTRLDTTAAVAATVALTGIIAGMAAHSAGARPAARPAAASIARATAGPALTSGPGSPGKAPPGKAPLGMAITGNAAISKAVPATAAPTTAAPGQAVPAGHAAPPLVLTALDHRKCSAAVTACVDLTRHITWLQAKGKVTFGPVQMEPGKPGGKHQTPLGRFRVAWKAGPSYVSNIYNEAMPWATFFAAGGIAFHGGSLTAWSHGCVHLTDANAHYYNEHLPIGARVVVF
jgi:lipoprotein-anchoring transpeptidase ErfK/SrfK